MKKGMFLLLLMCAALMWGCQSSDPSHKDMFILATRIAINHLRIEKGIALDKCKKREIPPEECEDAIDYERWASTLAKFEQHLEDSNDLSIGAEEIDLIADAILAEMGDDIDPRITAYIEDIRIILKMLIREECAKAAYADRK